MKEPQKITPHDGVDDQSDKTARELALGGFLSRRTPASTTGIVAAAIMYVVSMSPSLLPRTWWWQGVATGILIALAYGVGSLVGWLASSIWNAAELKVSANHTWVKWSTRALYAAAFIWVVWFLVRSYASNNRAAEVMGMQRMTVFDYLLATVTALVIATAITGIAVAIRGLWRIVRRHARKVMPDWIAGLAATVVVLVTVVFVTSDVLFEKGMEFAYGKFAEQDRAEVPGVEQPKEVERSGSTISFEQWENIGVQGKQFLASGPRAEKISEVTGKPAKEPIRIYAGLTEGRTLEDVAEVVVDEIRRTGAFERSVLVLTTATGTGWIEEWGVQPVEYLTRGDCATVTMQYSYVPSAVAFLREFDKPAQAGKVLYDAVMAELEKRPEDDRPAVYLHGVSLGAFGSQAMFEDETQLLEGVDGAVWAGTPNTTPLWKKLTAGRHAGSPEIAPVVNSGHNVRFATKPEDLQTDIYGRALPTWQFPRVAYLQHATDPVVWWEPSLISQQPDWLQEPAQADLNPDMQWTRGATFIQVSADLPIAGLAADGHGHTYHRELIPIWMDVLGLRGPTVPGNAYKSADGSWVDQQVIDRIVREIEIELYE
ncbi:MAG: alpha/beta-hydrolase family protein [Actinomycetaceae bacterium]|nr:alpha/beta-hydrolase family protein [Actinomycetaceae bacterium]